MAILNNLLHKSADPVKYWFRYQHQPLLPLTFSIKTNTLINCMTFLDPDSAPLLNLHKQTLAQTKKRTTGVINALMTAGWMAFQMMITTLLMMMMMVIEESEAVLSAHCPLDQYI